MKSEKKTRVKWQMEIFHRQRVISDPDEDPTLNSLNLTHEGIPIATQTLGGIHSIQTYPNQNQQPANCSKEKRWIAAMRGIPYHQVEDAEDAGLNVHRFEQRHEASDQRTSNSHLLLRSAVPITRNRRIWEQWRQISYGMGEERETEPWGKERCVPCMRTRPGCTLSWTSARGLTCWTGSASATACPSRSP